MAPEVFASIRNSRGTGASRRRSNERPFFSKVTVTASMDVVPKRTDSAMTPGSRAGMLSNPGRVVNGPPTPGRPERMKNIPVQASGKTIPQLMFGGFR
jgi:hypothetical protein